MSEFQLMRRAANRGAKRMCQMHMQPCFDRKGDEDKYFLKKKEGKELYCTKDLPLPF